jgi:hypothetical protein
MNADGSGPRLVTSEVSQSIMGRGRPSWRPRPANG